jgi:hypothetical protein
MYYLRKNSRNVVVERGYFVMLKEKLPLIGAFCLLILTIVNFTFNNESLTSVVGISLFILVLILYVVSRKGKKS